MAADWNFLAGRLTGDGGIDVTETDLPITVTSIDRTLAAPSAMSASITNATARLKRGGRPIFERGNTVVIAEASGVIRGMGVYRDSPTFTGATWQFGTVGLSGYPQGQPYDGDTTWVQADPLDLMRHVWAHLQGMPGGNLGVTLDGAASPVRVGTSPEQVEFEAAGEQVSFEAGPRRLNLWDTPDLGKVIDDLAAECPFDWVERNSWVGDAPHCHIGIGYPALGGRRSDLRLVLGENLATEPSVTEAAHVNAMYVLGAGEGRDQVRGYAGVTDGRIRQARVVEDQDLQSVAQANARARDELALSRGQLIVEQLEVFDHPNAPLEAIELGDELPLYAETDWQLVDQWVRVVGRSDAPGRTDRATLMVQRAVAV